MLGVRGRRDPVKFPERRFRIAELERIVTEAGLLVERLETFRFSAPPPFGDRARRVLNRLDKAVSPHRHGDVILVAAQRP